MYLRFLSPVLCALVTLSACDNSVSHFVTDSDAPTEGVETIDYFLPEQAGSDTIAYQPELGYALPERGILPVSTALIGNTTAGTDYRTDCEQGQVLAGLEGFASGDRVNQISPQCVAVDEDGSWLGSAQSLDAAVGISSGSPFSLTCESGFGVTGITGLTKNNAIGSLNIHCNKLDSQNTTVGQVQDSARVGEANSLVANQLCGSSAVASGIHGRSSAELLALGLVCIESPATAGRWGNPINWPLVAVHAVMTPQGDIMSYGFGSPQGSLFDYDIWDPTLGTTQASHNTFMSNQGVWSFCNASIVMPVSGSILMPGGTKINSDNAGMSEVPVYDPQSEVLSRVPDMANRRWYPTTVTLPSGEILVAGGRDVAGVPSNTPEIYSPEANEWRSLFGASMVGLDWSYPRLWVAKDGRVFGISKNRMYYINTEGSGFIQDAGSIPNEYATQGQGSEVMYAPGKILKIGGYSSGGRSALLIDINGATPEVRPTSLMNLARSAWANTQVLADGTVLAVGGSRKVNDAVTAALNAEIWDPATEQWTVLSAIKWPRLYHSSSVLLKDATVMVSGGGNPGPLTNYNAEIYSPPYLFNADGSPATRPQITWAPEQGAYEQTISVRSDTRDVSRVTFVKTSAVTHSFNVEQRFFDLPFTDEGAAGLKVQLPAAEEASPGHYMIFLLDTQGVPSQAHIIKLGSEAGAEPPAPVIEPEPVDATNLLVNGGFEQGTSNWQACSDASLSGVTNNVSRGEQALLQNSGACLYQEFPVQAGGSYMLSCDAKVQNSAYSSVSFNMLDNTYTELATQSAVVNSADYAPYSLGLQAPQGAAFAALTLYSEGPTYFDSCSVVASDVPPPPPPPPVVELEIPATNLLVNSDFNDGKTSWIDCASADSSNVITDDDGSFLQVQNAGCIYQEFPVTADVQYELQCSARSDGTQYSSITFQVADPSYNQLDSKVSVVGPGQLQNYAAAIIAPPSSNTGAVTIYSEDVVQVDACFIKQL